VRGRIVAGVAAWLLGACAATGGSLLAVSLIGKGMAAGYPTQTDAAQVAAARTPSAPATAAVPGAPTSPAAASARPQPTRPASWPPHSRRTGPSASPRSQTATSGAPAQSPTAQDGTVLASPGGEVVAACEAAGAYLLSWSPQQGYAVSGVDRGPAAVARVSFSSGFRTVTMLISCQAGVPVASTQSSQGQHPDE